MDIQVIDSQEIDKRLEIKIQAATSLLEQYFEVHPFAVLQFSGGKDSLACLELVRPWLSRINVLWANAGDAYPETLEQMRKVSQTVPHFFEVRGNASLSQVVQGYPVDMIPQVSIPETMFFDPDHTHPKMRLRYDCCTENWWRPMQDTVFKMGATLVIRGQRKTERLRNPAVENGATEAGVTYCLPLSDWTYEEVFEYLRMKGVEIPRSYEYGLGSLDCMLCTAYLFESKNKLRYLQDHHPAQAIEFGCRLFIINEAQQVEARRVQDILGMGIAQPAEMWAD